MQLERVIVCSAIVRDMHRMPIGTSSQRLQDFGRDRMGEPNGDVCFAENTILVKVKIVTNSQNISIYQQSYEVSFTV